MRLNRKQKSGSFGKSLLVIFLLLIIGAGTYAAIVFFEKEAPSIEIGGVNKYLAINSTFKLSANDGKSGLRSIKLIIQQGENSIEILNQEFPRRGYTGKIGPESFNQDIDFALDKKKLKDGDAEIILTARDYSLRGMLSGNTNELRKSVIIDTKAPKIRLIHSEQYISPGGSGIVIYEVLGESVAHGAEFSGNKHPGHPIGDGRDTVYIAYIALPYDAVGISKSAIYAEDEAGNRARFPFTPSFKKSRQKKDRINIGDGFLNSKIPEFEQYYPEMKGGMKEKYLYTNRKVRKANNEKIGELCRTSGSERLWKDKFQRMPGASKAGFADHRTYYYGGVEIDRQVHLGMDIASTRRAEVRAANAGKVIYADYLGIYGNMVILDHGQGVCSLYSHLSAIQVGVGDIVGPEVTIGLTGTTGMAGGDHLHFSMLVNGIFVTPKEWWDPLWISTNIDEPITSSKF